jgi:hypothetical protein
MGELGILKAEMEANLIPQTKAVKKALADQEEEIAREQEADVVSPSELAKMRKRLRLQLRALSRKPRTSSLFFGPGTRRNSRGRRAMNAAAAAAAAAANAELEAELERENARIQAANAAAAAGQHARMNELANMLSRTHIGPKIPIDNQQNPFTRNAPRRAVPGYQIEEGGSRRGRKRKTRRKSRSRR